MNDVQTFTIPILDGIRIRQYKGIVIVRNVRAVNIGSKGKSLLMASGKGAAVVIE